MVFTSKSYQINIDKNTSLDEYILYARKSNIDSLTFIIDEPISDIDFPTENSISLDEFNLIIDKINRLKQNNPDFKIYTCLLANYEVTKNSFLSELRSKVDEVTLKILSTNPNEYLNQLSLSLMSGIFDSLSDFENIFIYRDTLGIDERKEFDEKMKTIYESICLKLNEYKLPIKVNINNIPFSSLNFLRNVSYYETRVVPVKIVKSLNGLIESNEKSNLLKMVELNTINKYNPTIERMQNQKLNYIYNKTLMNSYTIYTERARKLLSTILKRIPKESERELIEYYILSNLDSSTKLDTEKSNYLDKGELNAISSIMTLNISNEEKQIKLENAKERLKQINNTFERRISLINLVKDSVKYAFQIGANSDSDILNIVTFLIEIQYTNNESKKRILVDQLTEIEERLKQGSSNKDESKLSKRNPLFSNESSIEGSSFIWNNGKINIFILILILTFILGFGIGIACMLLNLN